MKAVVWDKINHVTIEERPMPKADEGHVVVKVKAVGVCATDIHMISGNVALAQPPAILGHEIAGVIEEVGNAVHGWEKGDRVVIDTIVSCGRCTACKSGRKELCSERNEIGYNPYDGGYAEYVRVPAQCLVHLPESVSFRDAAIMESVACPFGAVLRIGVKPGSTVLVQGGGPAGIAFIQAAKLSGAKKVIASVKGKERMEYTKHFGADVVIDAKNEDVLARVMEITGGKGCEYVMDAAGTSESILLCFDACKNGGDVLYYGIPSADSKIEFPFMKMMLKQLRLHGILEYCAGWDVLVSLVESGRINLHDMVTHTFKLDEFSNVLDIYHSGDKNFIKMVIEN